MEGFEKLLEAERIFVERFVRYRLHSPADADDVLQEVYLTAFRKFHQLRSKDSFKAWIIRIARNKCNDYYKRKAKQLELSLEEMQETRLISTHGGIVEVSTVQETLANLKNTDQQILYLTYFKNLPQAQIAERLQIPLGTVKSRLHHAKERFKAEYPYSPKQKGEPIMKQLPDLIPAYTIHPSDQAPFPVKWEEVMGWFVVPKLGEKLTWAMYDDPLGNRTMTCKLEVTGRAEVHGIEGVEIQALEYEPVESEQLEGQNPVARTFVAQLTETHCRILAESQVENGVRKYRTFLDGEEFLRNWGFGVDNCGNETNPVPKGDITRSGREVVTVAEDELLDVVGRFHVTVGGKRYDTICVMDVENYCGSGVATEQYVDQNGRTVLWRRFNRDDWQWERNAGKPWSEVLPDSERITVNGKTYVHWYDCITDYIL